MNCRIVPVLKRLDHDPRDEVDEDKDAAICGAAGDKGRRDQPEEADRFD